MKLYWTRRALKEIDDIFAFVGRTNPDAAADLVGLIEQKAAALVFHPRMGRPGRNDETRELIVSGTPYILPYRVRGDRIEILAALHSSRDWPDEL
ncbi:MAG: type II toxin-antitoxin system mRNA interferase toxin, RelE/StbE family [Hyphomicrobiales bacterium]|nr:MAG: type II toxin-antitoxin system mRNA interferase toxin, RelE/StbE family [Hyphomicrobiales bacterium]